MAAEVIDFPVPAPEPTPPFRRQGLGYIFEPTAHRLRIRIDYLKRRGEDLHGVLTVESTMPGVPQHLHEATHNVSSLSARSTLAKHLLERAPELPWRDLLETFCVSVMRKEREGEPFMDVSGMPDKPRDIDQVELLLPYMAPTWLYGEEGSCKGNIAVAMCVCIATGMDFLGLKVRPARVAYLDWEDNGDEMHARLKAICQGMGVAMPKLFYRSCRRGGALKSQVNQIAQQFSELGIGFYVIDSVGLAAGLGSERGAPEDSALQLFEAMGVFEATALCIDHVNKSDAANKNAPAKAYGSMYKMALCRQAWEVRKDQEEGQDEAQIGLFNRKTNRGKKQMPIGLRLSWDAAGVLTFRREDVRDAPALASGVSLPARIQHALKRGGMTVKELAEELDTPEPNIRTTLHRNPGRFVKLPGESGYWGNLEDFR